MSIDPNNKIVYKIVYTGQSYDTIPQLSEARVSLNIIYSAIRFKSKHLKKSW